jgi:hypothetical protein
MKAQSWNVRAGVQVSPRYPSMRNRRIVVTLAYVEWEEDADEPDRTVIRVEEQGCEPDTYQMHDEGLHTAAHVAAHHIRNTYYASPVEHAEHHYEEVYDHPYVNRQEVTELELRGFRPDEIARVEKILTWWNGG